MTAAEELSSLLRRARQLQAVLQRTEGDGAAAHRLKRSVVRPLQAAHRHTAHHHEAKPGQSLGPDAAAPSTGEQLWQLANDVTTLRLMPGLPAEVLEATAALQDLTCQFPPDLGEDRVAARLAQLKEIQAGLGPGIRCQRNGPYLVTNAALFNWLGEPLPTRPQMALCRCGGSQIKPLCDGTHAEIHFKDEKDPNRVSDRRDTYLGQQVTILDNRGTCQHSGFCTDRLETVFRLNTDPFVAPSGGRMDEIIRAVRDCPSGALSYAIDGVEARDEVDYHGARDPSIEVSKDGPYRIAGGIPLSDGEGGDQPRNEGASLEHYALCRCGHSQNKPFCSGMHWYVDFKDPVRSPDARPTIFEWAGGLPALTRMTRLFYEKHVPQDPLLAPLFANMSPDHPQRVAKWLSEVFGGPGYYSEQYGGYPRMLSQHLGKALNEEKRARWVQLLVQSAQEAGLPNDPEFRSVFSSYIEWGSRLAVENSQVGAKPPEQMPMPHWEWDTAAGPPGSRVSALQPASEEDEPANLPDPQEAVSFEKHIKTFFRRRDRLSMQFAFDLWAYDDVNGNAQAILKRLREGSMPCDGAWPNERIDAFERWISTGKGQ